MGGDMGMGDSPSTTSRASSSSAGARKASDGKFTMAVDNIINLLPVHHPAVSHEDDDSLGALRDLDVVSKARACRQARAAAVRHVFHGSGPTAGGLFDLTKVVTTIGREPDNDIAVEAQYVSWHHCQVERTAIFSLRIPCAIASNAAAIRENLHESTHLSVYCGET